MFRINIHEAKTHLSRYLKRVARGQRILLCKRNVAVAEIRPIRPPPRGPRPVGLGRGTFKLAEPFFAPLPEAVLSSFEGKTPKNA